MRYRLIEIVLPEGRGDDISELLHERNLQGYWRDAAGENLARIRILLPAGEAEPVLDILDSYLSGLPNSSALLLPVEAVIPKKKEEPEQDAGEDEAGKAARISRHELYSDIASATELSANYLAMVVLSSIVAAIGLMRDDMAIIIGAMVLAPLLVPNVALALANTLGDTALAGKAIKTACCGLLLAGAIGFCFGMLLPVDPRIPAIAARTRLNWSDLVLALAAGGAGVLAFTGGTLLSLIGVMVAIALMPPLITAGLMFGSGLTAEGYGAAEIVIANIICVNIAGIVTFRLQGIQPSTWWERDRARRAIRKSLLSWLIMLVLLSIVLFRK